MKVQSVRSSAFCAASLDNRSGRALRTGAVVVVVLCLVYVPLWIHNSSNALSAVISILKSVLLFLGTTVIKIL